MLKDLINRLYWPATHLQSSNYCTLLSKTNSFCMIPCIKTPAAYFNLFAVNLDSTEHEIHADRIALTLNVDAVPTRAI